MGLRTCLIGTLLVSLASVGFADEATRHLNRLFPSPEKSIVEMTNSRLHVYVHNYGRNYFVDSAFFKRTPISIEEKIPDELIKTAVEETSPKKIKLYGYDSSKKGALFIYPTDSLSAYILHPSPDTTKITKSL